MHIPIVRPGMFTVQAAADARRLEFDAKNEVIVNNKLSVDFVFVGDSITHCWELQAYFGGTSRIVINRGIAGDKTEFAKRRFMADVIQLKPANAVIMIGINDTWVLDDKDAAGNTPHEVEQLIGKNIEAMVQMADEHGQKLILCSLLPTNIPGNRTNASRNEMIVRVNSRLEALAGRQSHLFVDYHSALVDQDGMTLRDGLTVDGLHPHVLGYNRMAQTLKTTLYQQGIEI
ncbi:GDSL-type esterase/lipase family protein [Paenibacillus sp. JDR-2]|uniref:GDSL-type esterase/lipase family protein n=1 Tax=Paenibacillus sp. (strain JDR-2) TaxID=324057 RepID=UPI0001666CF4|nr:GDSL-type esterase/lipase family protein [Paenibacillus sp. JDR-2]ACT01210.1 lipolytic protein G-D-S-L family [Paenibacillus sp. JDR-2]